MRFSHARRPKPQQIFLIIDPAAVKEGIKVRFYPILRGKHFDVDEDLVKQILVWRINHWKARGIIPTPDKIKKEINYIENSMKKYSPEMIKEIWEDSENPEVLWHRIRGLGLQQRDFIGDYLKDDKK